MSIPVQKKVEKSWQKPKAIIYPDRVSVVQGKDAKFYSRSTHDKSSKLKRLWTTKSGEKTTANKIRINTSRLKAGKYWVKLTIKDSKGFSDVDSALLVVTANSKKSEPKQDNKQLETKSIAEDKDKQPEETATAAEAELIEPTLPEKQAPTQTTTESTSSRSGIDKSYIEALSIEAENTTKSGKSTLSSEMATQQQEQSITLEQDKVNTQNVDVQIKPVLEQKNIQHTPNKSDQSIITNVSKGNNHLSEENKSFFSWVIWIWILLVLFIVAALLLILWRHNQRNHHAGTPNINYELQNDEGQQEVIMPKQTAESPLNPIHFSSQIDKGKQEISLKKKESDNERKKD